jgi:FkbM family methyltransferase
MVLNGLDDRYKGRVFVVQIGAGTGEGPPDLLPRFTEGTWSGLLIEPHPRYFAALETLHLQSDRVAVLNLGISDQPATLPLHALTEAAQARLNRPSQRASLIRDRIATPGIGPEDIDAVEAPFLRLDAVLGELGIDRCQLIVVNAGGHEEQVLRSVDLGALAPSAALVRTTAGTASDAAVAVALGTANLLPFRLGDWLVGLAPDTLAVPLDDLFPLFGLGLDQPEVSE